MKLTKNQKNMLKPFVERRLIAETAFFQASKVIHDTEKKLWDEITRICPHATQLKHPSKGDWEIIEKTKD